MALDSLQNFAIEFNRRFAGFLKAGSGNVPAVILDAVRYSALAPGKRIRPYLVMQSSRLVGGRDEDAWPVAVALECIHAFSLVHDDLPAMDDDDLRRGQPTTHKEFGEGIAILAGDALLCLAFEIVAANLAAHPRLPAIVQELAVATGWSGLVGGQAEDLEGEKVPPELDRVRRIHALKTARLFEAACRLGAHAANAPSETVARLAAFGMHLGMAFQIADDLLDALAPSAALGKKAGKDQSAGKQTFPACVGVEGARQAAEVEARLAIAHLEVFPAQAVDALGELTRYIIERNY